MRLIHTFLAAAVLSMVGAHAQAQVQVPPVDARLSATFRDPVGTVGPTDTIEMWVTLTSVGTHAVRFDIREPDPFGLPEGFILPAEGFEISPQNGPPELLPFDYYESINRYFFRFNSSDAFSAGGRQSPYQYGLPNDGRGWLDMPPLFELAAGDSMDVHLYSLTPRGGMAAPGTYQAFNVGVALAVYGYDVTGDIRLEADVFSATTCDGQVGPGCSFTRTVTAVPEPTSVAMLLAGLGVVGVAVARRRTPQSGRARQG